MGHQSDYELAWNDGAFKMAEVIAIALREWSGPAAFMRDDIAAAIAIALDREKVGMEGYTFQCIVKDVPAKWKEVTSEHYDEMLGCLPPIDQMSYGFLVGEAWDHHPTKGFPRYQAMLFWGGRYLESTRPIGRQEWRKLDMGLVNKNLILFGDDNAPAI